MADIDLFLQVLSNAHSKINYEYRPLDGPAVTTDPPRIIVHTVRSVVGIFHRDVRGEIVHRAQFNFSGQGRLEYFALD